MLFRAPLRRGAVNDFGGVHLDCAPHHTAGDAGQTPPAPTGPTSRIPSSITHNCSSDVTATMQAWINLAPDNSTISLLPKGCYRIDGTITLMNRSHLTLEGDDATLKALTTGDRTRRRVLVPVAPTLR